MSRTAILWAGSVADSSGIAQPERMLGEPNGLQTAHKTWAADSARLAGHTEEAG